MRWPWQKKEPKPEAMRVGSREIAPHPFRESARMIVQVDGCFVGCGVCGRLSNDPCHRQEEATL